MKLSIQIKECQRALNKAEKSENETKDYQVAYWNLAIQRHLAAQAQEVFNAEAVKYDALMKAKREAIATA